jgi:hypothetical protein
VAAASTATTAIPGDSGRLDCVAPDGDSGVRVATGYGVAVGVAVWVAVGVAVPVAVEVSAAAGVSVGSGGKSTTAVSFTGAPPAV